MIRTLNRNSLAAEAQPRERVGDQRAREQRADDVAADDDQRVQRVAQERPRRVESAPRQKLSQCQCSVGNHSGGTVNTGALSGLRATVIIQPSGSRTTAHSTSTAAYVSEQADAGDGCAGLGFARARTLGRRCDTVDLHVYASLSVDS